MGDEGHPEMESTEAAAGLAPGSGGIFPLWGYGALNLMAFAVLAVAFAATGRLVGDGRGLGAFFVLLGGGFFLASAFDALWDRFARRG